MIDVQRVQLQLMFASGALMVRPLTSVEFAPVSQLARIINELKPGSYPDGAIECAMKVQYFCELDNTLENLDNFIDSLGRRVLLGKKSLTLADYLSVSQQARKIPGKLNPYFDKKLPMLERQSDLVSSIMLRHLMLMTELRRQVREQLPVPPVRNPSSLCTPASARPCKPAKGRKVRCRSRGKSTRKVGSRVKATRLAMRRLGLRDQRTKGRSPYNA